MDEEPTVGSSPQPVVKPPATAAARNVRLKQATLSFGKTSATVVVENNVAGPSEMPHPRLNIDMDQLIADVYEDAHDKFKSQWYGFGELTQVTATWLQTTQLEHVLTSPFIGISLDESTDRCSGKHMILYVTFIRDSKVATEFMTLITVDKGDAAILVGLLVSHLQAVGIDLRQISGISTDGANVMMGSKSGLVTRLRLRIPHLVSSHCIAHKEALAAKHAAENIPAFHVVDKVIRTVAEHLGRSGPWHQRFMDLQDVFTSTSLELQGIHVVCWLSRGDAVLRFIVVLPGLIVMLKEWDADLAFQHKELDYAGVYGQIRRTTSHIESRCVDCGDDFGGGVSERLSPFLARHGLGGNREVTVEGVDSDGRPTRFKFKLHEDKVEDFEGPATHDGCVEVCTAFAEKIVFELESRLGDLEGMAGAKLFTPDEYPLDQAERLARCLQWLSSLVTLFKADKSEEILPGKP
ncbi:unnamed protein product [Closterium sp. NIES-53]